MSEEISQEKKSLEGRPWDGDPAEAAINFALGDLVNNLPRRLTVDGRIHAETLIAASGAIAGYAAQQAVFARTVETSGEGVATQLHIANTSNGGQYFLGDPLNEALVGGPDIDPRERLWPLAAAAAVQAGLKAESLPPLGSFFAHVSRTLGGADEGNPSIETYRFQLPAKELLRAVWPLALTCFNGELSGRMLNQPVPVPQRWRPVAAAWAAGSFIEKVAQVLPPLDALTILMETAIYASTLPPAQITAAPEPVPVEA